MIQIVESTKDKTALEAKLDDFLREKNVRSISVEAREKLVKYIWLMRILREAERGISIADEVEVAHRVRSICSRITEFAGGEINESLGTSRCRETINYLSTYPLETIPTSLLEELKLCLDEIWDSIVQHMVLILTRS